MHPDDRLAVRTDRIAPALQRLDAERRALLELSFLRGISDEEIAQLLGVTADEVHRRRGKGVDCLNDVLGVEGPEARGELAERLRTMPQAAWGISPTTPEGAGGTPTGVQAAGPASGEPTGDRRRAKLLAGLATGAIVAAVLIVAGPGHEDNTSEPRGKARDPGPARTEPTVRGPRSELKPIAGGEGRGVVQVLKAGARRRLLVSVSGLAPPGPGTYVVWLYRGVDDAKPIGAFEGGSLRLDARLPSDAGRYPALDISLEPRDANEAHGGDSVLRAPLVLPRVED